MMRQRLSQQRCGEGWYALLCARMCVCVCALCVCARACVCVRCVRVCVRCVRVHVCECAGVRQ